MTSTVTSNQLRGRAIGAFFLTFFGSIWIGLALYALGQLHTAAILGILAGITVLTFAALSLFRAAKRLPALPNDPTLSRKFNQVNAAQWIAVIVVAFTFHRLRIDAYVLDAITAIVGLHMFPLARLFRYRPHYVTGVVLVAWAVAAMFLVPADSLQAIDALGTGIILWLSSAVTLMLASFAARQPVVSLTPEI